MRRLRKGAVRMLIIFLMPVVLAGCGMNDANDSAANNQNGTGENSMKKMELSELESKLLTEAYGDAERIEKGELLEHQITGLEQLRTATECLSEKYPNQKFDVVSFTPANKLNNHATLIISDGSDHSYELTVTPSDGSYVCADNYYGTVVREAYDHYLQEKLSESGYEVISYTFFSSLLGEEADESISVEKIKVMDPPVMRTTHLFVYNEVEQSEVAEKLQQILVSDELYGSYTVFFVSEHDGKDVRKLEENRSEFERKVFNCFSF